MPRNLISLDDFNNRTLGITPPKSPKRNGIACPKCGEELYDSDTMILTSYPAKKNIHCEACSYKGYRYA